MDIDELTSIARQVRSAYSAHNKLAGHPEWTVDNYLTGFIGDVGDLAKLLMARAGLRSADNLDMMIEHELSDCLWSVLIIADQLGLDLAAAYRQNMKDLLDRISRQQDAAEPRVRVR